MQLGRRRVALAATRRSPDGFRVVFERARSEVGYARCLCCAGQPRLVIRRRGSRYWLACWPGGGGDHDPGCRFFHHDSPATSGRDGYTRSALDELGGAARIRLADALTTGPRRERDQPPEPTSTRTGHRHRMSLRALLEYLWERAELNGLGPPSWERDWAACCRALHGLLAQLTINNEKLTDTLWVVPPYRKATAPIHHALFRAFTDRLTRSRTSARRGLVLGAVKDLSPSPHGHRIRLRHHPVPLWLSTELLDRLTRSVPQAFSDRRPTGSERVVLALIEKSPRGYHTVVAAAVMLTSGSFVPADSSYEVRMADALAAARRSFVKPLRYDSIDAAFPDFVLLDSDPPTVVEVWGMTGREEYDHRRRDKRRYYGAELGLDADMSPQLLEWDVRNPLPTIGPPGNPHRSA